MESTISAFVITVDDKGGRHRQHVQSEASKLGTPWEFVEGVKLAPRESSPHYSALLRKSADCRTFPFPGHTYPAATVIGIPSAVKRLRTAARTWTSATWRSKSRDISRWPSSFTQFIFVSTLLRR